jgi:predicted naringenin-chalcone synthase
LACTLSHFKIQRPPYETSQAETLEWILEAHTKAESVSQKCAIDSTAMVQFREQLRERLWHVGCKPDTIAKRGHFLPDFRHRDWDKMELFTLDKDPLGLGLERRSQLFKQFTDQVVDSFYPRDEKPPEEILHVSCTGYVSPSCAQTLVSRRGWHGQTSVTHAYHMGCYAAIPAVRIAAALTKNRAGRADIIHTELCTLHKNPLLHRADQLVGQSLFADGCIRYSVSNSIPETAHFTLIESHEEIIPNSLDAMQWNLTDWGFLFVLSKEIPVLISKALPGFLEALCNKAGVNSQEVIEQAIFAIHPGGPKINRYVQKIFGLADRQIFHSQQILYDYGNMSSATLPHVWERVCRDAQVANGTKIVSLAFGPGLTIVGMLLEKVSR